MCSNQTRLEPLLVHKISVRYSDDLHALSCRLSILPSRMINSSTTDLCIPANCHFFLPLNVSRARSALRSLLRSRIPLLANRCILMVPGLRGIRGSTYQAIQLTLLNTKASKNVKSKRGGGGVFVLPWWHSNFFLVCGARTRQPVTSSPSPLLLITPNGFSLLRLESHLR